MNVARHGRELGQRRVQRHRLITVSADLDGQMQAALAGKKGYAYDSRDTATLFQDSAAVTPVSAPGQPVGAWKSKWGVAQGTMSNVVASSPLWDGTHLIFDNVDDSFNMPPAPTTGDEDFVASVSFNVKSLSTNNPLFGAGVGATGGGRHLSLAITTTGTISLVAISGAGATNETFSSATGVIQAGVDYVISVAIDYIVGTIFVYLNGSPVISASFAGPAGAFTAVPNRWRFARVSQDTQGVFDGSVSRVVFMREAVDAATLNLFENWVGEAA